MSTTNGRTADYPIDPIFLNRWSPRTFTGETISDSDLFTMLEAARWAPSSSNLQPWRFLYAKRDTSEWTLFFDPLVDGNKRWVAGTSVLVAIVSKKMGVQQGTGTLKENYSHSFDAGASWAYLALQASLMGWNAHAMAGLDYARAVKDLAIPDDYRLEAMVAIGRYKAPEDGAAAPNSRSPLTSFVRAGVFEA